MIKILLIYLNVEEVINAILVQELCYSAIPDKMTKVAGSARLVVSVILMREQLLSAPEGNMVLQLELRIVLNVLTGLDAGQEQHLH